MTERDELILREIDRWRACRSKHGKSLIHVGTGKEKIKTEKISLGDNSSIIQKMTASHPRITLRIKHLEEFDELVK